MRNGVIILDVRKRVREGREFVEMGGEQTEAADFGRDVSGARGL